MKEKVLVTAIGTITATNIVKILRRETDYYIIGADVNAKENIVTSNEVDEFYEFPYAVNNPDYYLKYVLDFCNENRINYYFAVIDKEVVNISKHRDLFDKIGTRLCVPEMDFVEAVHYKDVFSRWISKNIPEIEIKTYDPDESIDNYEFPVFIKPIEGVASLGCQKIDSKQELLSVFSKTNRNNYVVQHYMEGNHFTVDLVRNRDFDQTIQVQREELLRNANGCGIAVKIVAIPKLHEICDKLMKLLDLNGVANAEFFEIDGDFYIIEINPRFSAGNGYTFYAGIDLVECAIDIVKHQKCNCHDVFVGKHFAERYEIFEMN